MNDVVVGRSYQDGETLKYARSFGLGGPVAADYDAKRSAILGSASRLLQFDGRSREVTAAAGKTRSG